ncbi:MAG TPA: adenylate/guanylate cyclase domain-containing protein [Roseiarcus sp.]|nr:adenylate/guanylate cyclase domain-containing protein [Roseiarcus sp.]
MSGARRLAAILAIDVAGYSRLMGEDEARTAKAVRERREAAAPIVRGFGGRLVKTTGDGALLEFPSIVAAVECAILMQKMMAERNAALPEGKRILYRIGVNLGDVLIEDDDILGDGVNVAARLEGICESGGVCVSGAAFEHVQGRVAVDFAELGEQSLKNIARPIRAFALSPETIAAAGLDMPEATAPSKRLPSASERCEPPRLSLVVLPFANFGGDPEQEYFVDGITDSLTTDLSRIRGAFVVGRGTAFTYKGKAVDHRQVGRELNIRYLLEGSVQRGGARMRVNVQLIEAESGNHLWAERFDKPVADLFDMQDEIVARLANQLLGEFVTAEARRAATAPNPDSTDLYFQAAALLYRGLTPDILSEARALYERAFELDSANVDALVGVGAAKALLGSLYMTADPASMLADAEETLAKALLLAPDHAVGHFCMGIVFCSTCRAQRGVEELERALAINPNLAAATAFMGLAQAYVGRAQEAEAYVREAMRLSPRDPLIYAWFSHLGEAKACLGEFDQALPWVRKSIGANRNLPWNHFLMASCLAHLGRIDDARKEVLAGLALDPDFTIGRHRSLLESDNPVYLAQRERLAEGMRLAGVPEA